MRLTKLHVVLTGILAASFVANLLLALAVRHCYIQSKLISAEPTFVHVYRHDNATLRPGTGLPRLVLFGDSRVKDWDPPPQATGHSVVNRGIGGETTAQMMHRLKTDVLNLHPTAVVIQAGINDLVAAGLTPQRERAIYSSAVTNLTDMVRQAEKSGIRVILLTIIPPARPSLLRRLVWSSRIDVLVAAANRELVDLHAPPRVHVVDTRVLLQAPSGVSKRNVRTDTLHLSAAGYKVLNVAVDDILLRQ